jgi:hypothetical protein
MIVRVEEQVEVSLMGLLVVNHGGGCDPAVLEAVLAEGLALKLRPSCSVLPAPLREVVEPSPGYGLSTALVSRHVTALLPIRGPWGCR